MKGVKKFLTFFSYERRSKSSKTDIDGHYKFHCVMVSTICHYNIAQLTVRPHLTIMYTSL